MVSFLPAFTASTYNMRGASAYARDSVSRKCKTRNIVALTNKYDIVNLQETNLNKNDKTYLKSIIPKGSRFFLNNGWGHLGVATIVSAKVLRAFSVASIPFPSALGGRALALLFTPKSGAAPFTFVNLYLKSGTDQKARAEQLSLVRDSVPVTDFIFFAGDFNFVENKFEDTSSHSTYYDHSTDFRKVWEKN